MYMQRTTSGAAGNCLRTTAKYMRGAAGIGTTIKHLRRTTSGAAGNFLGATMKYLRRTMSAAASNGLSTTAILSCSEASFKSKLRASHRGTPLGPFVCGA
jgi:tRNA U55 pseudouridine synthase TruB